MILGVLGAIGVFNYGWLVSEGLQGTKTWVVDFFETSNPVYRVWAKALPDYLELPASMWPLHWLWILVLLGGATVWTATTAQGRRGPADSAR